MRNSDADVCTNSHRDARASALKLSSLAKLPVAMLARRREDEHFSLSAMSLFSIIFNYGGDKTIHLIDSYSNY